jgi:serine/threonine protein kinase
MDPFINQSLTELRSKSIRTFRQGGGSRPHVCLVSAAGHKAVLKDYHACDPWFARLLAPLLAAREARALRLLDDVVRVPSLLSTPDRRSLLIQYLPAQPLLKVDAVVDWEPFFRDLRQLLETIHARGVAHSDLRSPNNTLLDAAGRPVIVDFVASVQRGRRWNLPGKWLFQAFSRADRDAIAKLKRHVAPELLTDAERALLTRRGPLERSARWLGRGVRNVTRKLFTGGG